jgi:hypothetical protein
MIMARYLGVSNEILQHGKMYQIKTHCINWQGKAYLEVSFGERFRYCVRYGSLEGFLKYWKVEVIYHEQSRAQKSRARSTKE